MRLGWSSVRAAARTRTGLDKPLGLQEVESSRQSAQEGDKVDSSTHRLHLPPRRYSCPHFSRD